MESFRRVTCEQALACFARRAGWMAASVGGHDDAVGPRHTPSDFRRFEWELSREREGVKRDSAKTKIKMMR